VTYNQLFTVQPFNNVMNVKTMTGAQLYALLEQQFDNPTAGALRFLQVSSGFEYTWSASASPHIVAGSMSIDGTAVDPMASYQVAMNNFLASGGDGFSVFNQGTNQLGGEIDIDALVNYFMAKAAQGQAVAPGPQDRITRIP
jgi:5'-nucleotidase